MIQFVSGKKRARRVLQQHLKHCFSRCKDDFAPCLERNPPAALLYACMNTKETDKETLNEQMSKGICRRIYERSIVAELIGLTT